jgi:ketosteroid isomerase-like protein
MPLRARLRGARSLSHLTVPARDTSRVSENLDLVRSIYADWEFGNFSSSDWAHPEVEVVIADGPAPGKWTGRAGMAQSHREFLSAYEGLRMVANEYRELDEERVLVLVRIEGRGKTSGMDLRDIMSDRKAADLFHIRDGQVIRLVIYYDTEDALADLGVEE